MVLRTPRTTITSPPDARTSVRMAPLSHAYASVRGVTQFQLYRAVEYADALKGLCTANPHEGQCDSEAHVVPCLRLLTMFLKLQEERELPQDPVTKDAADPLALALLLRAGHTGDAVKAAFRESMRSCVPTTSDWDGSTSALLKYACLATLREHFPADGRDWCADFPCEDNEQLRIQLWRTVDRSTRPVDQLLMLYGVKDEDAALDVLIRDFGDRCLDILHRGHAMTPETAKAFVGALLRSGRDTHWIWQQIATVSASSLGWNGVFDNVSKHDWLCFASHYAENPHDFRHLLTNAKVDFSDEPSELLCSCWTGTNADPALWLSLLPMIACAEASVCAMLPFFAANVEDWTYADVERAAGILQNSGTPDNVRLAREIMWAQGYY